MTLRNIITAGIITLSIIFILAITIPTLKDSITNYDFNKDQSFTKIIWSFAQLLAIIYIVYKRITKRNRIYNKN